MSMIKSIIALSAAGLVFAASCGDLTNVTNIGLVQPESIDNANGAVARYAGAYKAFVSVYTAVVQTSGTFADEYIGTSQVGDDADGFLTDARRPYTVGLPTTRSVNFTAMSGSLVNLGYATEALRTFAPNPASRIGLMLGFTGYVETFLAEQYCSGIPFSTITNDGQVTYGSGTTTADTYARALAHFDSALIVAVDSARILNMIRVGRGRVLLDLGRYAEAAAAVAAVPTSYLFNIEYSAATGGVQNTAFAVVNTTRWKTVGEGDGGVGLNFRSANDPRVPVVNVGVGTDGVTPLFQFGRFTSLSSPIALATGIEARLIQAEAALQANQNDATTTGTGWLGVLNSLRATAITPAMPALADPGNFNARVDLLFRERAFWLFLTAHRMSDMRRLVRQYNRAINSVFPSGNWKDGQPYGNEVDFNIPLSEAPNASFSGCIERKP